MSPEPDLTTDEARARIRLLSAVNPATDLTRS